MLNKKLIVITGPTASGKSALALDIARKLSTEIISADSRQIYRDIPIVTAAPTAEDLAAVPHHLVGCLPLDAYYSASSFEQDALRILDEIFARHDVAVMCGGSMMYVDTLCNGIDPLPTVPEDIRAATYHDAEVNGADWMREELRRLDPEYYGRVDLQNLKRVIHAVEISRTAGVPYSSLLTGKKVMRPFQIEKYAISMPRDVLFQRINSRVLKMMEQGLMEEAKRVYPLRHLNSLNTVGLKELFAYFDGVWDLDTAIARIQKNTRVYAKKQLTWLQRDPSIRWIKNHIPL